MRKIIYILVIGLVLGCASMNIARFHGPNDGRASVVGDFKDVAEPGKLSVMLRVNENGSYDVTKTACSPVDETDSLISRLCPNGTKDIDGTMLCSGREPIKYNDIKNAVERSGVPMHDEYERVYMFRRFKKDSVSVVFYTTDRLNAESRALQAVVFH